MATAVAALKLRRGLAADVAAYATASGLDGECLWATDTQELFICQSGTAYQIGSDLATQITVADTTDASCYVALFESATGDLAPKTDAGLTYDATTGTLTATAFAGPLTGNVTGNVSGSSGSCTGNAATATALETARTINGTSFDGTANITVTAAAGTLTGTTLNSSVVTSSLTTVGTLTGGATGSGFTIALSVSTVTGTLHVPNGGTGRTTSTAYAVICGGTGSTAAQQSIASVGTAGQLLTSNGAGALPTFQNPITQTSGEEVLSATFNCTGSSGTFQAVQSSSSDWDIALAAGTYRISLDCRYGILGDTAGSYMQVRLYNVSDGSAVSNSTRLLPQQTNVSEARVGTTRLSWIVTVASAKTVRVELARTGSTVWTASYIASDSAGYSALSYTRLY